MRHSTKNMQSYTDQKNARNNDGNNSRLRHSRKSVPVGKRIQIGTQDLSADNLKEEPMNTLDGSKHVYIHDYHDNVSSI